MSNTCLPCCANSANAFFINLLLMATQRSSFPTTFAHLGTQHLLGVYEAGPQRLRQALAELTEDDLRAHPRGADAWSIHQIVLHMADSEMMGAARVRQTISQSAREFAYYNQAIWAEKLGYASQPHEAFEDALMLLGMLRRTTGRLFRNATTEAWSRTAIHAEMGEVTLRNLLELYADHIERHLGQILDSRQLLGKPLTMPLLLEERLY